MKEGSKGFYTTLEKTPQQQKAAAKRAKKKLNKEEREAAKLKAQEDAMEVIRVQLQQAKLVAAKAKEDAYVKAREDNPAKFPPYFNDASAKDLIDGIDFSQADYVETVKSERMVTRRALVHHIFQDREDEEWQFDCWVGANIHPDDRAPEGWKAGSSYILQYKEGFEVDTSAKNVRVISALPANKGQKPDVLW